RSRPEGEDLVTRAEWIGATTLMVVGMGVVVRIAAWPNRDRPRRVDVDRESIQPIINCRVCGRSVAIPMERRTRRHRWGVPSTWKRALPAPRVPIRVPGLCTSGTGGMIQRPDAS